MSTPLTDRIEALTAQANAKTGASDTTLTDAVETLIAGFGSGGDIELWKTVTLEEAHESAGIANPVYWGQFLEITTQEDFGGALYLALFIGNTGTVKPDFNADLLIYLQYGGEIKSINARGGYASAGLSMATSRSLHASEGTVIKIYKIGGLTS